MNIIAIDASGHHNAVSTAKSKTYVFQTALMTSPELGERLHVPLS
jgi:hypothetical protein